MQTLQNFFSSRSKTNRGNNTRNSLVNKEEVLRENVPTRNEILMGTLYEKLNKSPLGAYGNLLELNKQPVPKQNKPINQNLLNLFKSFDRGLFVDNDEEKIAEIDSCGDKMTVRKVTETAKRPPGVLLKDPVYQEHLGKLSTTGLESASVLQAIIKLAAGGVTYQEREYLDIPSGIDEERSKDITFIKNWVTSNSGKKLAALFDYDRTLTVTEGGYFLGNGTSLQAMKDMLQTTYKIPAEGLTAEGFVEYYSGGYKRLAMLQDMFDFLYANNVTIYILTNNGSCKKDGLFREIISVYTRGRPFVTLCGVDYGGNKKKTLQSLPVLRQLCSTAGGGRRRKTRHVKKQRHKQTHKRRKNRSK